MLLFILSIFSVKVEGFSLLADFSCKYFQFFLDQHFLTNKTPKCHRRKKSEHNYPMREYNTEVQDFTICHCFCFI